VNRRWRITSTLVLIGLYLLTGVVALHWWMALGPYSQPLGDSSSGRKVQLGAHHHGPCCRSSVGSDLLSYFV
jgi:hypothetical protein